MPRDQQPLSVLRGLWQGDPGSADDVDYSILAEVDGAYGAWSRAREPALVIPLVDLGPTPVGRSASGFELIGHPSTRLIFGGRDTIGPAAALICKDPGLVDAFAVLAADVAKRSKVDGRTWSIILGIVEDWQTLLAPRGRPSEERESGLWGELWFLTQAEDIDAGLAAWCGPERDATDFFRDGKGAEVKTSRRHRDHHVSLSQVEAPVGVHEAWLLSIWVKRDPGGSTTVAQLAETVLDRAADRGDALRRLARAGYSPADRREYTSAFVILAEPEWYEVADVPRVRTADPGVSQLRYRVTLDDSRRAQGPLATSLWRHFHGHDYRGA